MRDLPAFVILPGLDATRLLLHEFAEMLGRHAAVQVIAYPADEPMLYDELVAFVGARLPATPYILIGESFSGPIALRLGMAPSPALRGIILGASFARLDLPMKPLLALLAGLVPARRTPMVLLNQIFANGGLHSGQCAALRQALTEVDQSVLVARARETLRVDLAATGTRIRTPGLYLRGRRDRLMPKTAAATVTSLMEDCTVIEIDAPHFLFQTDPAPCAEAILAFAGALPR